MGMHVMALIKLKLLTSSHSICPMVAALIWPFVLKLSFSIRPVRRAYCEMLYASRLFFFQLGQIAFDAEPAGAAFNTGARWERALRLVYQRITRAVQAPAVQSDEDNMHALSMVAL